MRWLEGGRLEIEPPQRPLKMTGTRFAAALGLHLWSSPFAAWCEITRTYKEPITDTTYIDAGKAIEPKQIDYMRRAYVMNNLRTPSDVFGDDYFKRTRGDFFQEHAFLGGMWDALLQSGSDPTCVLEFKTTKRAEDWLGKTPEYYALQAALYAYLLGVDEVILICSILRDADYLKPDAFVPSVRNTFTREFHVSERYPSFHDVVKSASVWWANHVLTGVSPPIDRWKDKHILQALKARDR